MQLCDTGREIRWSINRNLPAGLSDEALNDLLDTGRAKPLESYPSVRPVIEWPIEQESMASAVRRGFWPVVVVSFAAICGVVTLLLARLWR